MENMSIIEHHQTLWVSYRPLVLRHHVIAPLVLISIRSRELPEQRPAQTRRVEEEKGQNRRNVWRQGWPGRRKKLTRRIAKLSAGTGAWVVILSSW